jgi:hypothetical protein
LKPPVDVSNPDTEASLRAVLGTERQAATCPVSSSVTRLLDRLPESPYRLIAAVLGINLAAVVVSVLLARYVTHESTPPRVLWDGRLMVGSVLNLILLAPALDTLLMMVLAFLVSWFSPLSITRATTGQTVIGVGLLMGLLFAAIRLADIPKTVIHFALLTYVYLRYRRISRRTGFRMAFATQCVQNCLAAAMLIIAQRWFLD